MSHRRRAIVAVAALATAGIVAVSTAQGAQWTKAVYPATSGAATAPWSTQFAVAQAPNGKATLLYLAKGGNVYSVQRSSASGSWGKPSQWVAASKSKIDTKPAVFDAVWGGGSTWAFWSTGKGHKVASTTGTWKAGTGGSVRTSGNLDGSTTAAVTPSFSVAMSCCVDQAAFGMNLSGNVVAGTIPWGKAPSVTQSTPMATPVVPSGVGQQSVLSTSSTGEVAALLSNSAVPGMVETSANAGGQFDPGTTFSPYSTPADIQVDALGNGAVAYWAPLTAAGAPAPVTATRPDAIGVFVSQRVGRTAAWGTPQLVMSLPLGATPCFTQFTGLMSGPWGAGFDGLQVAVGGGTTAVAFLCSGSGGVTPIVYVSSAATGQTLPQPTQWVDQSANPNSTSITLSVFDLATNASGQAMAMLGYGETQGQTDSLSTTTSPGPGQPWKWLVAIDDCNLGKRAGAGNGFGDAQIAPFTTGFTVVWQCQDADGTWKTNNVGIATYK